LLEKLKRNPTCMKWGTSGEQFSVDLSKADREPFGRGELWISDPMIVQKKQKRNVLAGFIPQATNQETIFKPLYNKVSKSRPPAS